jgi:hypothetical protein
MAVRHHRKHQARPGGLTIEQDRARATDAVFTTNMGACQSQDMPQEIAQQQTRLHLTFIQFAINSYGEIKRFVNVHRLSFLRQA